MSTDKAIGDAQRATALSINHMLTSASMGELTQFDLDEITELAEDIGRVLPAGNVVQMVFSQLRSARGRRIDHQDSKRMMSLLQQGISTMLDKASYLTFYSTPALLISGYQLLLRAAGRDPNESFPHGIWQFYLEFGLREDAARHACETIGFQQELATLRTGLSEADQLAANLLAAGDILFVYHQLLILEWQERVLLTRMGNMLDDGRVVKQWLARRPYNVPTDKQTSYVQYRQRVFNEFVRERLSSSMKEHDVDATLVAWKQQDTLTSDDRQAYQQQMSLLAQLQPSTYSDERVSLDLEDCSIGVIWNSNYYLVPLAHRGQRLPPHLTRSMAHAIVNSHEPVDDVQADRWLTHIPRASQQNARMALPRTLRDEIDLIRTAPIIINWDVADAGLPLSYIRQGQRGIGDHPLTIFRTDYSLVFDQSHIFFDATWGMAIAEIYTNFAMGHLRTMTSSIAVAGANIRPKKLDLSVPSDVRRKLHKFYTPTREVSSESKSDIVDDMNKVRKLFKKRSKTLHVTINDLLILYRSLHNQIYQPNETLLAKVEAFGKENRANRALAAEIRTMLDDIPQTIPAILIPIDASAHNPAARLFPITFCPREPWTDLYDQHKHVWELLQNYQDLPIPAAWDEFTEARVYYLQMLKMFGVLMQRYKDIALEGKSFSTVTLKMLAGVPKSLQEMLRDIPDRVNVLNDMLKGTEVFSNVGRVADTSTLWRFITAKDDNHKKELCWGIMTRADNTMIISLRDFRPTVARLLEANAAELAQDITDDFLYSYVHGLEQFIRQLSEITRTRRR